MSQAAGNNRPQHQPQSDLLRRCADNDPSAWQELIHLQDKSLVKAATGNASLANIQTLLDAKSTFPEIEQPILEEAAKLGKADVVRYVLQQGPNIILTSDIRHLAILGGSVPVWRELIAFDPQCANLEIGHHGDALGVAVGLNKEALVAFLLEEGNVDIEESNYVAMPVLPFAVRRNKSQTIIDLLTSHGARMKDSVDS